MIPVSKTLETDIAVVGGGIGGLCAAIAAAEGGARGTVLEKANTKRSGSGATGNDPVITRSSTAATSGPSCANCSTALSGCATTLCFPCAFLRGASPSWTSGTSGAST